MEYKLSEIFELQMGKTPERKNSDYWSKATEPWISIADLSKCGKYIDKTTECISKQAVEKSGIKVIPQNTVIMSFKLSIGKLAITSKEMYSNEAIMAFINKGIIKVEPTYLYYLLMNKEWNEGTNKAVMGKTLNKATLSEIKIRIHEHEKQLKIIDVLDKTKSSIDKRKQQLEQLDLLIKARFVEMFGEPYTNSKGWDKYALSEKLSVLGGYAFKSNQFDENDGVPVLRIGNINGGVFRPVNMVFWKEDVNLQKYVAYPGDLVMSLTGTVGKDDYGNVCILNDDYEMYYLNQRNAKLEIKEGIDKHYLSYLLKFEQIKKKLTGISRGVRQANISNKDILNLVVPVPPMDLQNQFATFVHQVDKSKVAVQKSLEESQLLFDSLMQQYFG